MAHVEMARTGLRRTGSVALALLLSGGLALVAVGGAAGAKPATPLEGSAVGVSAPDLTIFGGAQTPYGPTPTATLPAGGSTTAVTGSDASESVVYGPATLFTSGAVDVSTQGTQSGGSVTSSVTLSGITNAHGETMTADSLSSTCTANGANSASTTVTNGVVATDIDANGNIVTSEAVPANPSPGFTINGTLALSATDTETFTWVFNEQTTNRDGSITVNAAHYELHGPTTKGDIFLGQSMCGFTASAATTTTAASTTTTTGATTTTTTTVLPTTTTTLKKHGNGTGGGHHH